jgi:hypothetical protein
MAENRFTAWAARHVSRAGHTPADPVERAAPPPAAPTLPAPPPGYGYAIHPQHGYILVPLTVQAPAPASAIQAPPRQPNGAVFYAPQPNMTVPHPGRPPAKVLPFASSCHLVKPGNRDTYAELMSTVPDLVPATGYDAMRGEVSPETQAELGGFAEFQQAMGGDGSLAAFPTEGRGVPVARAQDLNAPPIPVQNTGG